MIIAYCDHITNVICYTCFQSSKGPKTNKNSQLCLVLKEMPSFEENFYNLKGIHYNERKGNFYRLLKSVDTDMLAAQSERLLPRNYLERIFYVEVLIRTKQMDKLLDILREGNRTLVKMVLRQGWFFKEAFKNTCDKVIVHEILPILSHSVRMKVLKRLSLVLPEDKLDKMFDQLLQRYGMTVAQTILCSCSAKKLSALFQLNKFNLNDKQLRQLLHKDINLVKTYLDSERRISKAPNRDNFLRYSLTVHPELYFELKSYFSDTLRLGRGTTKKILRMFESVEIEDCFHVAAVTRHCRDFGIRHLWMYFPREVSRIESMPLLWTILKSYPNKKRWSLFSDSFRKVYKDDVNNRLEAIPKIIVSTAPDDVKQQWAEICLQKSNDVKYFAYFTDSMKAFLMVKERIGRKSIDSLTTSKMLLILVEICHKLGDYNTYDKLLHYFCIEQRNVDEYSISRFLSAVASNINYDLTTLSFWGYVRELIDISRTKVRYLPWENISQYIIYLYKNNLALDEAVDQYMKDITKDKKPCWYFHYFDEEPEIKAHFMERAMKFIPSMRGTTRKILTADLVTELISFNKQYKNRMDLNQYHVIVEFLRQYTVKKDKYDQIDIRCISHIVENNFGTDAGEPLKFCSDDELFDVVKHVCSKHKEAAGRLGLMLLTIVRKPRTSEFQTKLLDYYMTDLLADECSFHHRKAIIKYLLTEEPDMLAKYLDVVLPLEVETTCLEYPLVKFYSHLMLDKRVIAYFVSLIGSKCDRETKLMLLRHLSEIMPAEEYLNLISKHVPIHQNEIATVIRTLKNLEEPCKLDKLVWGENPKVQSAGHMIVLLSQTTELAVFNVLMQKEKEDPVAKKKLLRKLPKYLSRNQSKIC